MTKDPRVLTLSIVECPAGGFVIKDGSLSDPDITAKSTLREAQNACADMIGLFFLPPADDDEIDENETFEPPRVMRAGHEPKRGFFKAIMGGKT